MSNYEINENTIALIPYNNMTRIYENDDVLLVNLKTQDIIKNSCEFFGSSYEGRKRGTLTLTGITHKVPIIIEESKNIIFFPTMSPREKNCSWIALKHINTYKKVGCFVNIQFKNNRNLLFNISYSSLDNQILRASRLDYILNSRKI